MGGDPVNPRNPVTFRAGSVEHLTATVSAEVTLTTQTVAFSVDHGATWLPGEWLDTAATTRRARTVTPLTMAATTPPRAVTVYVKVTDAPEVPVMQAGTFIVRPL
jgi:hypothetical protein